MIETFQRELPHGITLSCRATGEPGRPLMMFLHGFPEAAFIWDELLAYFAQPEHGGYRCLAPNLRGFEKSSSPKEVEAYKARLLIQDMVELVLSSRVKVPGCGELMMTSRPTWPGNWLAWPQPKAPPQSCATRVSILPSARSLFTNSTMSWISRRAL